MTVLLILLFAYITANVIGLMMGTIYMAESYGEDKDLYILFFDDVWQDKESKLYKKILLTIMLTILLPAVLIFMGGVKLFHKANEV